MFGYPELKIEHFDLAAQWLEKKSAPPRLDGVHHSQQDWYNEKECGTACCFFGASALLAGLEIWTVPRLDENTSPFEYSLYYRVLLAADFDADQIVAAYRKLRKEYPDVRLPATNHQAF